MKVYRCSFHDPSLGVMLSWHSSKREAQQHLRKLQADRDAPTGFEGVECIDIPTDRAGLLRLLNSNLNSDNG